VIGLCEGNIEKVLDIFKDEISLCNFDILTKTDSSFIYQFNNTNITHIKIILDYTYYDYNADAGVTTPYNSSTSETVIQKNNSTVYLVNSSYGTITATFNNTDNKLTVTATSNCIINNVHIVSVSTDNGATYIADLSNYVKWYAYLGDNNYQYQNANDSTVTGLKSYLINNFGFQEPSIPYIAMRLEYNQSNNNSLSNFTFVIKGQKILDLVSDTVTYTNNSANVLWDYLTNKTYGIGIDEHILDKQSFIDAANYCNRKKFVFNAIITDGEAGSIVEMITAHIGGAVFVPTLKYDSTNKLYKFSYKLKVFDLLDTIDPLPTTVIYEDDILENSFSIQSGNKNDMPNGVRVKFINSEINYKTDEVYVGYIQQNLELLQNKGVDFTLSDWVKTNTTVVLNSSVPDVKKSTYTYKATPTVSRNSFISIDVTSLTVAGMKYYFSFWAKSTNANGVTNGTPIILIANDNNTPSLPVRKASLDIFSGTEWRKITKDFTFTGTTRKIWIYLPSEAYICYATLSSAEPVGFQEEPREANLELWGATRGMAIYLATRYLDRARLDTQISFSMPLLQYTSNTASIFDIGDLFYLNYEEFGINNQLFRVVDIKKDIETDVFNITAIIEDVSLYDQTLNKHTFTIDLTTLPYYLDKPATPSLSLSSVVETNKSYLGTSSIIATITQPSPFVQYHEVLVADNSNFTNAQSYRVSGSNGAIEKIAGLQPNKTYYVKARAFNINGVASNYSATQSLLTAVDTTPPSAPSTITIVSGTKSLQIYWSAVSDSDLKEYVLERSVNNGAYSEVYRGLATGYTDSLQGVSNRLYRHKCSSVYKL